MSATDFLADMETEATNWLVAQVNGALPDALNLTVDPTNGVSITLTVPNAPVVTLSDLTWAGGSPSGELKLAVTAGHDASLDLFGGLNVALTAFDLKLNPGLAATISGTLDVPFFSGSDTVNVDISVKSDGSLSVTLSAQQNNATPDGLPQLSYTFGLATVTITLSSLTVSETNGNWSVSLAGSLDIETADLQWPTFDLKGLSVDSRGKVSLEGGWINLPSQTALSFYGFTVALHQLGFGSDASGDWIGFNGDIQLVEGISLGGSVQGMKLNLGTGTVSFTGVGIDMEIPGVIAFNGAVDHISLQSGDDPTTYGLPAGFPVPADVFAGHVDVTIEAAGNLEVDGSFVVAHVTQKDGSVTTAFFLALDLELPVGIPLFLDVSLYGLSGLFATNLAPVDPTLSGDTWWDWYKYDSRDAVIDKSGTEYSATDEQKWLNPVPGAFALGAGATIGTQDDGFTASAAIAFMILLPGPIIAFVGKADILSTRINGASGDANFQAMATYDGTSETFDMVVQAQYSIPVVLDIEATAELYADGSGVWFLALGKPPREQRVRARIFDLFETDAYFVVSNTGLMTGTWTGYKNSWSFGPLSASLDAYLATLAAIQWKPLQIAAGIELHGEVHLSAFGIGVGITADALLEGTAPNPFWVYGSLQVELDLPWPLPNVGATISLSWGGNDGTVPPAPLALSAVNAVLVDHGTSDRYELLAHRGTPVNAASPGDTVVYDSAAPGILAASPSGYWTAKDPNVANDYPSIAPDLDPSTLGWASVVPQDSHFTLAFAHQTTDYVGFANETAPVPADPVTVSTPGIVGADDLSNLNPNPPAVQWLIEHALLEVALYAYDADAATWQLASASPQGAAPLDLPGVWLARAPGESAAKPNTALKIVPYTLRRGSFESAAWGDTLETFGTHFSDQGLQFDCGPGIAPVSVAAPSQSTPAGLEFRSSVAGAGAAVTITFATTVTLNAIEVLTVGGGEFPYSAATFTAGGVVLNPANLSQDPSTNIFTLSFDSTTPPVTQIEMTVLGEPTFLFGIAYQTPDVKLPILPAAPALYALKVVTRIGAGRVDGNGNAAFAPLPDANPVIEFAYFQTASGPGVGTIDAPSAPQSPFVRPAEPNLGDAAPPAPKSFPTAGRLNDLATYFQWSWPTDGDLYAYYGYDFSAEFDETYVVELYEALSLGGEDFAIARERSIPLHFRCVDRNNAHTFSIPVATQVASLPQQSALVAALVVPPYPQTIAPPADSPVVPYDPVVFGRASLQIREAMSGRRLILRSDDAATRTVLQSAARAVSGTALTGSLGGSLALNPGLGTGLQHVIAELEAAAAARAAWFQRLAPRTRYRLDIVPGPAGVALGRFGNYTYPSYPAIAQAPDAIGAYAALLAYFAGEDKLTSLRRIEFATSRYATFSAHVANAVAQTQAASGATPIRRYGAQVDPQVWLANAANGDGTRTAAQSAYEAARTALAQVAATFDPLQDALLPGTAPPAANSNGQGALKLQRAATGAAWDAFAAATAASFDGLVTALGWPQFADARHAPLPPDTELSVFTANADTDVVALLLESPEPILWRRLWAWTTLQPRGFLSEPLAGTTVLWNADGTRALLVPQGRVVGTYALSMRFQGDIGPEAPCISLDAVAVDEGVTFAPLVFVPLRIWRQPTRDVLLG
jgi:hypothetical protein